MRLAVGEGSCGVAAGAIRVADAAEKYIKENSLDFYVIPVGCIGMCFLEPIVYVENDEGQRNFYTKVTPEGVAEIIDSENKGEVCEKYRMPGIYKDRLDSQTRIALRHCGLINPESIDEYIENGGYESIKSCVTGKKPTEVIDIIKTSGLAGRGGAGFPTWFKWNEARKNSGPNKYTICNADEGDPGAFMDRAVIEGDPHSVIEGMMIGAYAMGSDQGVVYCRAEYPLAVVRLNKAIKDAREKGILGKNIFGSDFSFDMIVKEGAGAFVCGEETALIASLEGERGMPRLKPPFPAAKGYWQCPSNINNVETYANVAWIIANGGEAFAAMGTPGSKGTKVFALTGKVKEGGLVEIPMGKTVRDVIYGAGGGIKEDREFKAVQMGGPSGGCIPASLLDTVIDYKSLSATGAIMGSGGMVVMDETTCMVDMARFFLDFTREESCGKCAPCRLGTQRMLEILTRICDGKGRDGDIELLEELANEIKSTALCGLGQTAPNPVLTTIRYFRNEYEDHIYNHKCTAHSCKALITYKIDPEKCKGCTLCARNCPAKAISGKVKEAHTIDTEKCIKCGKCEQNCKFGAIVRD